MNEPNTPNQPVERDKKFPPIVVAKSLRSPHPLVGQAAQLLDLVEPNHVGILEPTDRRCLGIRVSRESLRRALRILDALIKALVERGFEVSQGDDSIMVQIHGESVGFRINEEITTNKTQTEDTDLVFKE